MLSVFFDCEDVVHYEFAPRGQAIHKEYYVEVLERLRDSVKRKRPRFWSSGDWLLNHDNAPAHSSNLVQQFLAKHKIVQLHQPPYSLDIAPCDFWIFPKLKMALKGKRFDDIETIQSNMRRASWRPFQNLRSRTALRCGSTAGSVWFNQMGTTSKDATPTVRMSKNSKNAEIWTRVGYFLNTPRMYYIFNRRHENLCRNPEMFLAASMRITTQIL